MSTHAWGRVCLCTNLLAMALAIFFTTFAPSAAAQSTGIILGTVRDASGASVPDANVTVLNTDTGQARTATTGSDGAFRIPALQVGHYTVKVEKAGFKTQAEQ